MITKLHHENFDLKLELFYRRQQAGAIAQNLEKFENLRSHCKKLEGMNELLREEIRKRDMVLKDREAAIEDALHLISSMDAKIKELECKVRQLAANASSGQKSNLTSTCNVYEESKGKRDQKDAISTSGYHDPVPLNLNAGNLPCMRKSSAQSKLSDASKPEPNPITNVSPKLKSMRSRYSWESRSRPLSSNKALRSFYANSNPSVLSSARPLTPDTLDGQQYDDNSEVFMLKSPSTISAVSLFGESDFPSKFGSPKLPCTKKKIPKTPSSLIQGNMLSAREYLTQPSTSLFDCGANSSHQALPPTPDTMRTDEGKVQLPNDDITDRQAKSSIESMRSSKNKISSSTPRLPSERSSITTLSCAMDDHTKSDFAASKNGLTIDTNPSHVPIGEPSNKNPAVHRISFTNADTKPGPGRIVDTIIRQAQNEEPRNKKSLPGKTSPFTDQDKKLDSRESEAGPIIDVSVSNTQNEGPSDKYDLVEAHSCDMSFDDHQVSDNISSHFREERSKLGSAKFTTRSMSDINFSHTLNEEPDDNNDSVQVQPSDIGLNDYQLFKFMDDFSSPKGHNPRPKPVPFVTNLMFDGEGIDTVKSSGKRSSPSHAIRGLGR